jgi:signal transduction histidine kinase
MVVGGLHWDHHRAETRLLELNEREHVKLLGEIIAADFRSVVSDLMILAESRSLKVLAAGNDPLARRAVAHEYQQFLEHKQVYDQARFLEEQGMEVVRVNYRDGRGVIVPDDQLQSKRDRYYVREALKLRPGEVFVSPLDLNVEDGRIEVPFKPTIRFATPVVDDSGQRRGIVVLNYNGSQLLDKLRRHSVHVAGKARLLNAAGYWLAGPSPDQEWGFLPELPQRRHFTLAEQSPQVWRQLQVDEAGQFRAPDGIYTFRTIYPLRTLQADAPRAARAVATQIVDYRWKIVSHVEPHKLQEQARALWKNLFLTWLSLGGVLALVTWLFARVHVQHRRAREQLLVQERLAAIGHAMTALAHESRNALQRSRAGLEMLHKRVAGNSEAVELLTAVQDSQTYLTELYEQVRSYAAPINVHCAATDLDQLAQETWEHLAAQHPGCTLREVPPSPTQGQVALPADQRVCAVDRRAMGQVLRNLFENALASAHPAEVSLSWSATKLAGRPALRLAIRDNGPGVPAAQRAMIFEPFYTTKVRGTGLGLAISRRIVEAHGGEIGLAESDGCGAEFWITIPRGAA